MMNIDKNLPIDVLKALKEFIVNLNSSPKLFHIINKNDFLLKIADNDISSGFYFNIEKFDPQKGVLIDYKPQNSGNTNSFRTYVQPKDIAFYFGIWHNCLIELNELEAFFKDPFLKNLEDQFFAEFDLDEETKNDPLSLKQINILEENLSKIENSIEEYGTESNIQVIEDIIQETKYVKSQLGKQTKEWIAKKVSTVLAKITKEGPDILKGIFKEAGKQIMSQGVKYLLENPDKLLP